jgi:GAF domain-containing protein
VFFGLSDDVVIVEDTLEHRRFSVHPFVTGAPYVRFYASARLMVKGQTLGTLCVYDTKPKKVTPSQTEQLRLLGRAAMEILRQRQPD